MKLMLAAAAALTTLAGFGTTAVHADTSPVVDIGIPKCVAIGANDGLGTGIETCYYCASVTGVPPIIVRFGADATATPVPDIWNLNQVCTDSPVGDI